MVRDGTSESNANLERIVRVLRPGGVMVISNRIGWQARLMPGKAFPRSALGDVLRDLGAVSVQITPWQMDYDLVMALKPLHDLAKVKRVVVATYQSSSGKGAKGLVDFEAQVADLLGQRAALEGELASARAEIDAGAEAARLAAARSAALVAEWARR